MQSTLCTLPYALYPMHSTLCTVPYALYPMHSALCTLPYALCPMHCEIYIDLGFEVHRAECIGQSA